LAVERYINDLAAGIINIISILSPEIICIGGGISNEWDCLSEPLQAAVDAEKYTRFSPQSPKTRIARAKLGNDAGIIGAALLGLRFTDR
jgi:glucokinase